MQVKHLSEVSAAPVEMEGAVGCTVRWLVDERDGAPNFAMRQFEVAPGGHTPRHQHPYEHEVFVLEGSGIVDGESAPRPLGPGDSVFVAPGELHQFRNTGTAPLKFLCLVPHAALSTRQSAPSECDGPATS